MMKNTTLEELLAKAATFEGQRQASLADLATGREALAEVLARIKSEMLPTFGPEAEALSVVAGGATIHLVDPAASVGLRAAVYQLVLGAYRLKTAGRKSEADGYFAALAFLVYGAATCEEVLRGMEETVRAADKVPTGRAI
jgi:hypothetical protein